MKLLSLLIVIMLNLTPSQQINYARVLNENVYLYSRANDQAIMFELPITYFVRLESQVGNFYKVNYNGISGYVKKDSVFPIKGTPIKPYLTDATFRIFTTDGGYLRVLPKKDSSIYCTLPIDVAIEYIGQVSGEELVSKRGTTWYYTKYTKNNETYTGYVYAGLCDLLLNVVENNEQFDYTTNPFSSQSNEYINYLKTDKNFQTILCIIVSLPALIVVFLLFKPIAKNKNSTNKQKNITLQYEDKEI